MNSESGKYKITQRSFDWATTLLGFYAAIIALQHGLFLLLQGREKPGGVLIQAMGQPCDPDKVWHACFPAMTLIPDFLLSGIIVVLLGFGLGVTVFTTMAPARGRLLLFFALGLLFTGGGFVPVFIAGITGSYILFVEYFHSKTGCRFCNTTWKIPLLILYFWIPLSWTAGLLFRETMILLSGPLFLIFDIILPFLILTASRNNDNKIINNGNEVK